MNAETLKYFQYIARYKNITQAAKHLYVSQSTLSRHIMSLENELGVNLFKRNNKMVTLTEAGETLYRDSESLINHMDATVKNVVSAGRGQTGILKITAPKSLYKKLSEALAISNEHFPSVKYFVESYDFSEIPLAIKYNLYDIGVTYDFALYEHESLEQHIIGSDDFVIICSSKCVKNSENETLKEIVNNLPFISPSYVDPPFHQDVLAILQQKTGHIIRHIIDVNTTDSLILNASLGLGYGLVPHSWVNLLGPSNDLHHIHPAGTPLSSPIVAVCKKSNNSELTSTFFDILREQF
ncbi:MAG: LysR family transcriptional regulator [Suipraeoptans sp.]